MGVGQVAKSGESHLSLARTSAQAAFGSTPSIPSKPATMRLPGSEAKEEYIAAVPDG